MSATKGYLRVRQYVYLKLFLIRGGDGFFTKPKVTTGNRCRYLLYLGKFDGAGRVINILLPHKSCW